MNNIIDIQNIVDATIEVPFDMKMVEISFHEKYSVFDVQLMNIPFLSQYDFVELDISFFPLSRHITSEDYEFEPFEHYIDETKTNKSMYRSQQDLREHFSWLWTAAILTGIVAKFNPKNITETESLVALVASYFAWMKGWPQIESFLINKSAKWKLQFKERYFQYTQNIASTWEKYDNYAKKERYKMENIRPDQIGMVIDSIRQKMRLRFTRKQLLALPTWAGKANVMNISLPEWLYDDFFKKWVQIGVHIKLWEKIKYMPILHTRSELIQTLLITWWKDERYKTWCIYDENDWFSEWEIEHRETTALNRIKYYNEFNHIKWDIIKYIYKPIKKLEIVPENTLSDNL
jgi:hypothetical protein